MRWSLAVVMSLGCDAGRPNPPETAPQRVAPAVIHVDAAVAKVPFEVLLDEIAVDHPIYPPPKPGTRLRSDAKAIQEDVERAVQRELGRISACVNEPKLAAISVAWKIAPGGRAIDARAGASLTSPGQDPVRDKCIADVIGTIVFSPPGRVAPIAMVLWIKTAED